MKRRRLPHNGSQIPSRADAVDFRILPESAGFDFPFCLIERIWNELATPYAPDERLDELTPGQRALYALHWVRAEVCNGGFDQCFSNSTGYLMPEAIDGARRLGSSEWSELLTDAAAVLGNPFPPGRDERNERLDALLSAQELVLEECDSRMYDLDAEPATNLDTLIARYVTQHPDEFYIAAPDESTAALALLETARQAINARFRPDLDLAERLLVESRTRALGAGDASTAALAQSLLDQIPSLRG